MIFYDYAAHTPPEKEVLDAFVKAAQIIGNPNSAHLSGRLAKEIIDKSLSDIKSRLKITGGELIITSGATESNNTAIKGIFSAQRHLGKHILVSPFEHPSVMATLAYLQTKGAETEILKTDRAGKVDIDDLKNRLREDTVLAVICGVDGETGAQQDLQEIWQVLKNTNCKLHTDLTQAVGKAAVDFSFVDTASFAPHKFFGLCGIGGLYIKDGLILEPLIIGGGNIMRGGTPSTALIASFASAVNIMQNNFDEHLKTVSEVSRFLCEKLSDFDGVRINSPFCAVPHIINLGVKDIKASAFQKALDEKEVCVSIKSACSLLNAPSAAVFALYGDKRRASESWRISLSYKNSMAEAQQFIKIFGQCLAELK